MTVKQVMVLYSRAECHLCRLAAEMLERGGFSWREVDIDEDPVLAEKYGIHVPVVQRPDNGRELFFPFDEFSLRLFAENET
jgi:glutaredoxin